MVSCVTIISGQGRDGRPEPVDALRWSMGEVVSIVGPTGSGKTTLINDVALFASGQTPTRRQVLFDGAAPPAEFREDPAHNPVAIITQHTNFLSDLPVGKFLAIHASVRNGKTADSDSLVEQTLAFANELTGEPIAAGWRMTELSGGQTRALLIADAVVIGNAPIVLLDEIENAGIHRTRAMELLRRHRKIFVFVTHDPYIALLSDVRVVMSGGMIVKVMRLTDEERKLSSRVRSLDDSLANLRNKIRRGETLSSRELEAIA